MTLAALIVAVGASAYNLSVGNSEHGSISFSIDGNAVREAEAGQTVTVTVTPDNGYTTKAVSVTAYTTWDAAGAPNRVSTIPLLKDFDATATADGNVWTFVMPSAHVDVNATYKANLSLLTLEETNFVYNKAEQFGVPQEVKATGDLVVPATDYTVTVNGGTTVGTYTVTVTANDDSEDFAGEASAQYSIIPADAQLFAITLDPTSFVFDGTEKTPAATVKDGNDVLVEGTDYTLVYENNVNAGTAKVTATGMGNYENTQVATFTIKKAQAAVTAPKPIEGLVYNAYIQTIHEPGMTSGGRMQYSLNDQNFFNDVRYVIHAGTYTVYYRVVGGNDYEDVPSQSITVTVAPAPVKVTANAATKVYGKEDPELTYEAEGLFLNEELSGELAREEGEEVGEYAITLGTLTSSDDYTLTFESAQLTITPKGVRRLDTEVDEPGTDGIPALVVTDGDETLEEGTDYTVRYEDAEGNPVTPEEMEDGGEYVAVLTFSGNYTGERRVAFTVKKPVATDISKVNGIAADGAWHDLSGRKLNGKPSVKGIYIVDGKKVVVK